MKTRLLLISLLGVAPSGAFAQAAPPAGAFDLTGFELHETRQVGTSIVPNVRLISGYGDTAYQPLARGAVLSADAIKPSAYHAQQPRTELTENTRWRWQDGGGLFQVGLHVDRMPRRGTTVLGEISDEGRKPFLTLSMDGDRVLLVAQNNKGKTYRGVVGTITPDRRIVYQIGTRPDGAFEVVVNGTRSLFQLDTVFLATPVSFRTGAYAVGDIGRGPDSVQISYDGLSARHFPVASVSRS